MTKNHKNFEDPVYKIAQKHFEQDEGLEKVIWITPENTTEIRFIEVTRFTPPLGTAESYPILPPDGIEVPCPMYIAFIRPEEWQKVLMHQIPLPEGWDLKDHLVFYNSNPPPASVPKIKEASLQSSYKAAEHQRNGIEGTVTRLVREHFELEEKLQKAVWIKTGITPAIRLLEVNPDTPASGDVLSFYFPPWEEVPYPLHIAEVTPEEWRQVERGEIPLPEGWTLENCKIFSREMVAA